MNLNVLDNFPASTFVLDENDDLVFANDEAKRFETMANRPFVPGMCFMDLIPDAHKDIVRAALQKARTRKEQSLLESEYRDKKGYVSYFETIYSPFEGSDNRGDLVCVLFREITGEKVFQKRMTQLVQEYTGMVENANAVIFSIDSRQYLTDWNSECGRITSFSKNEALTQQLQRFIDPACWGEFQLFLDLVFHGTPGSNFELHFRTKTNEIVNVLINATPKINAEGRVIGVLFVGHDVTELSEYRKSLERLVVDRTEKLKVALEKEKELVDIRNRFVSMASHELRIPLSTIAASASYVRNKTSDEGVMEKLNTIEKQITHMKSLIDDVLTLGKTEGTKIKASLRRLDLVTLLNTLAREVEQNTQQTHSIVLKSSLPVIEMETDEKLLRNVFLNLFSNAVKFSPSASEIWVDISAQSQAVVVSVSDKGIGIPQDDLVRIFEPFNRGGNAGNIKGTGLGLSIVKRAVDALGGSINIESVPEKGTTLTVRFNVFL